MNLDRRNFIRLLSSSLLVPIVEPKIIYILPPINGWHSTGRHYDVIIQDDLVEVGSGITAFYDFLMANEYFLKGLAKAPDYTVLQTIYSDRRAASALHFKSR
jgi:hypothetical protein